MVYLDYFKSDIILPLIFLFYFSFILVYSNL